MELVLPDPPRPAGAYRPAKLVDGFLYLASFGPRDADGKPVAGLVGADLDIDDAAALARNVGLTLLSVMLDTLGSLDRVRQVVSVTGMVRAIPEFEAHPAVIDGCSKVLVEALGERGTHARAAFGVTSLPFGAPVSIGCVCQVEP
jgi:enamine deaminase RidA (YjgF/YER057c/UK114 family)